MPKRKYRHRKRIPDDLMYAVCERFMQHDNGGGDNGSGAEREWSTKSLAEWLTEQGYETSREQIFPLIRQAIRRGFLG